MKKIGEIIIEDKGYSPRIESLYDTSEVKVVRIGGNTQHSVYKNIADKLLGHLHWMTQFVKWQRVDDQLKDWRK